jgi:DMSO/TMAO reductase YedYZ molybdopterin-dependent catalytic subunit
MKRLFPTIALALCLAMGSARAAEDSPPVVIDGLVKHSLQVGAADLRAMPSVTREVSFQTDHGPQKATYRGVLLWTLIAQAEVNDGAKFGELRHVMAITGKDGYLVMFSLGEIDPNFGQAPIMVAYERDAQPIAGGLRLVVPGDVHGARDIRDLVHIEIR